jgi:hypothetical protein
VVDAGHQHVGQLGMRAWAAATTEPEYSGGSWPNIPSGARTKTAGQASWPSARSTSPERSSLAASSRTASRRTLEASSGGCPARS